MKKVIGIMSCIIVSTVYSADQLKSKSEGCMAGPSRISIPSTTTALQQTPGESNDKQNIRFSNQDLFDAVVDGDLLKVEALIIAAGIKPNCRDQYQCTPLHYAALYGHKAIVKRLIGAEGDPESQTNNGYRPLHFAAHNGHQNVVNILLDHVDTNSTTLDGRTALHIAAQAGHDTVVQLLSQEPDVQPFIKDAYDMSPYQRALTGQHHTSAAFIKPPFWHEQRYRNHLVALGGILQVTAMLWYVYLYIQFKYTSY